MLVVGAGGLGSVTVTYLAASGIGTIGVVDDDVVETSNLQRQVIHGTSDVGRPKTASASDRVAELNPHVRVIRHDVRLTAANAMEILAGYDVVVDGADNFPTRYLVADACGLLGLPHVWGSIYQFDGQASVWSVGEGPCYRCAFPSPPPPDAVPSCADGGVLGALCAVIGSVQATEAVKLVLGIGQPLVGRLLVHDALRQSWDTIPVQRNPDCQLCGDHPTITTLEDLPGWCRVPAEPVRGEDGIAPALAPIAALLPTTLAERLAARDRGADDLVLVDVRDAGERDIVSIPGSEVIEMADFESGAAHRKLPERASVVIYCKSGVRSLEAARRLAEAGRSDVSHLDGGVVAWVRDVDPTLPIY